MLKVVKDALEILHCGNPHHPLLNLMPWLEHLAVPVRDLTEQQTAQALAAIFDQQMKMPRHECQPLVIARGRTRSAGLFPAPQLRKEPGIQERAAADGNGGAAGL